MEVCVRRFMCESLCMAVYVWRFVYGGLCVEVNVCRFVCLGLCVEVCVLRFSIWRFCFCSLICDSVHYVLSSFAIISLRNRELGLRL